MIMHAGKSAVRRGVRPVILLIAALAAGCATSPGNESPGTTSRTLAPAEVDGLLSGRGMGMAAPAEINGYPGPVHVLELKEELGLTPDQRFATSRLVGMVQGQARALGQRIIDAEKRLDADMAANSLGADRIRARLEAIAALRAQLRFTHIHAHMEQREILTPEQLARYYELRGRDVTVPAPALPVAPSEPLELPTPAAPVNEPVAPDVAPKPEPLPAQPVEELPAPSTTVPGEAPDAPSPEPEEPASPETAPSSPGMQDAVESADAPAYPLTPVGEPSQPRALLPADDDAAAEPESAPPVLSPGMRDAMEFAEPVPPGDAPEEAIYVAPLEDEKHEDASEESATTGQRKPVSVELD